MVTQSTLLPLDGAARKPDGGFAFITVTQLAMVWWAYESGLIRFIDLRTYFACFELVSRRCELERWQKPEFGPAEVHGLTGGVGGEHTRHSLARLQAVGLLSFSETSIKFAASPDAMPGELAGFWELLAKIENNKRKVPVPRRVVRFLAHGAGRVVTATVLGHLLRCLYYRNGECKPMGNCKASWVADVFGVNASNVKAARQHLIEIGLFVLVEMPQWHRNRWGARIGVNLQWRGASGGVDGQTRLQSDLRPPSELSTTVSRPPCLNQKPLPEREYKNQKPTSGGPTGVFIRERGREQPAEKPSIRHVVRNDLTDTGRLLELHRQAVEKGLAKPGERGRLEFVSLAEHALTFGKKNPCGLFVSNLKNRRFGFINQTDEDDANRRIKEHLYRDERAAARAVGGLTAAPAKRAEPTPMSDLARFVLAVQRVCESQHLPLSPFVVACRHRPGLTREDWETGLAEIEQHRLEQIRSSQPVQDAEPESELGWF